MDKGKQPLVTGSANVFSEDVICLSEPVDKAKGLTVAESFGISQDLMSRFGTAAAQTTESVSDHGNTKKTGAAYDQANQTRRKRSREGTPTTDGEGKTHTQGSQVSKEIAVSDKMMAVTPAGVAGQLVGPAVSSAMTTALELRNSSSVHTKTNPTSAAQPSVVLPLEAWLQLSKSSTMPNLKKLLTSLTLFWGPEGSAESTMIQKGVPHKIEKLHVRAICEKRLMCSS